MAAQPTELDLATIAWCRAKRRLEDTQERFAYKGQGLSNTMLAVARQAFDEACTRRAAARAATQGRA